MSETATKVGLELEGARVLVAGGASHLGRAITLAFAQQGCHVVVADIDAEQAARTAERALELGAPSSSARPADLTDPADAEGTAAWMASSLGGIDVLVNNVGWHIPTWFRDIDAVTVDRTLDLNLVATINCLRAVTPIMTTQGHGAIVSIASDAAFGDVKASIYGAAKAGIISLTRSLARENGRKGVRLNAVAPGLLESPEPDAVGEASMWRENNAGVTPGQREAILKAIPLGRITTSEDVAAAVLFFASPRMSGQLTGQVLSVSGGYAMP